MYIFHKHINEFRYWNFRRTFFVSLYILIGILSPISLYKSLYYPKIESNPIVVYKDKYVTSTGDLKFFVEVKDSSGLRKEEIKFGYQYDTIEVGSKINLKEYPVNAFVYGLLSLIGFLFILFKFYRFWEILTRTERFENE